MKSTSLLPVIAVCSFALGFGLDRLLLPKPQPTPTLPEATEAAPVVLRVDTNASALDSSQAQPVEELGASLNRALSEPSPGRREEALYRISHSIAVQDIPRALAYLARRREPEALTIGYQLVARWTQTSPRPALAYALSLPRSPKRDKTFRIVLAEWTAADAPAALQWLKSQPPGFDKNHWMDTLIYSLTDQGAPAALAAVASLGASRSAGNRLQGIVLRRWAESNPAAAAAAAAQIPDLSNAILGDLAGQWASVDAKAALGWAQALRSPQAREQAIARVATAWVATDASGATAFVLSQPIGSPRQNMLESVIHQWSSTDPTAALNWAAGLPEGPDRNFVLQSLLQQCAATNPQEIAPYVGELTLGLGEGGPVLSKLATSLAAQDPQAAILWASGLPSEQQALVAAPLASALLQTDPKLAADFVASLPTGLVQAGAMRSLALDWGHQDLSAALAWLQQLPPSENRDSALGGLFRQLGQTDPQSAVARLEGLPAESQGACLEQVASAWAQKDPTAALKWAETLPSGTSRDGALARVVAGWATASPVDAAQYAADMPSGAGQEQAVRNIINIWATSNPKSASQWVGQFPAGQLRDDAVAQLSGVWTVRDAAAAANWLDTTYPNAYEQQKESSVWTWLQFDRKAAQAWIPTSSLNAAAKQRFLGPGAIAPQ